MNRGTFAEKIIIVNSITCSLNITQFFTKLQGMLEVRNPLWFNLQVSSSKDNI